MAASESYPDDLLYHPEHDWARIDGDEAVLGVTWYAQDALGELVHYEPPDVGCDGRQGRVLRRGRVGEGGLGSDLAALGRGARGERGGRRRARDRERGSLRRRLADPDPPLEPRRARQLLDLAAYQRRPRRRSELPLADRRRPRGDARGDRRLVRRRALPGHPGGRSLPPRARRAAGAHRGGAAAAPRGARRARTSSTRSASSAAASTTTTSRRSSTPCCSAASC